MFLLFVVDLLFDDALLLGMYTLIDPLRSNYGSVKLTSTEEEHLKNIENKQNHIYNNKIYMFDLKTNKDLKGPADGFQ